MKKIIAVLFILTILALCLTPFASAQTRKYKAGDYITFGKYEQDNNLNNGKEPIEWLVLEVQSNGAYLLISRYVLDAKPYNTTLSGKTTWETCSLREWLNEDFYNAAFSKAEKERIIQANLVNGRTVQWRDSENTVVCDNGNDTVDKVWTLSMQEKYNRLNFEYPQAQCISTAYAIAQGIYLDSDYKINGRFAAVWWLRDVNWDYTGAYTTRNDGNTNSWSTTMNDKHVGVRPVIILSPETVSSSGAVPVSRYYGSFTAKASSTYPNNYAATPNCAIDSDTNTAWNANKANVGEWLEISTTDGKAVIIEGFKIANGYWKSKEVYTNNSRVRSMDVYADGVFVQSFDLKDNRGQYETCYFTGPIKAKRLRFVITAAYQGAKYKDLCITEIEFFGSSTKSIN